MLIADHGFVVTKAEVYIGEILIWYKYYLVYK